MGTPKDSGAQQPIFTIRHTAAATVCYCCAAFYLLLGWLIVPDNRDSLVGLWISMGCLSFFGGLLPALWFSLNTTKVYEDRIRARKWFSWREHGFSGVWGWEYGGECFSDALYLFFEDNRRIKLPYRGVKKSGAQLAAVARILRDRGVPDMFRSGDGTVRADPTEAVIKPHRSERAVSALCIGLSVFMFAGMYFYRQDPKIQEITNLFVILIVLGMFLAGVAMAVRYKRDIIYIGPRSLVVHRVFRKPWEIPYPSIEKGVVSYEGKAINRVQNKSHGIELHVGKGRLSVSQSQPGYIALIYMLSHYGVRLVV